jgi:ribose 5-phosphate isomerase B
LKLIFGSDHAGYGLRTQLAEQAELDGHQVSQVGAMSESSYDYPDAAEELVPRILNGDFELGVLICGSGTGICIAANRHKGIRAANCCSVESAELARQHNHANVLCLGARLVTFESAVAMMRAFLAAEPDPNSRHLRRIAKLDA